MALPEEAEQEVVGQSVGDLANETNRRSRSDKESGGAGEGAVDSARSRMEALFAPTQSADESSRHDVPRQHVKGLRGPSRGAGPLPQPP